VEAILAHLAGRVKTPPELERVNARHGIAPDIGPNAGERLVTQRKVEASERFVSPTRVGTDDRFACQ